jgi:hypothetical protein
MTASGDRQRGDLLAATGENRMTVDSRLVQALDAAAEHKPKMRNSARRGRPAR